MARDSSGNYSLPSGNPVVTGTSIDSTWANDTMDDLASEVTNSLERNGKGGMLAALRGIDGTKAAPAVSWTNETGSGFYRAGAGDVRITVLGVDIARFHSSNGFQIWNGASWDTIVVTTGGLDNVVEDTTPQLGGNLDVNGKSIVSASNGAITITPNGTGDIILDGQKWPQADGTVNQILKTNGAGQTAWTSTPSFTGLTVTSSVTFSGATVANGGSVTTVDINGGTIDGATIGATSHTTGKFTTLQATGKLTLGAEYAEFVGAMPAGTTPAIDPANGTVQTWTLSGNSTPTNSLASGESVTLHILDGTAYTIDWATSSAVDVWIGGSAPTLDTTNVNVVQLWNVGGTNYAASIGIAS